MNPRCPPAPTAVEVKVVEIDLGEGLGGGCRCRETGLILVILGDFCMGNCFATSCMLLFFATLGTF